MKHIIKKQILALEIPSGVDSWKTSDDFKELFNSDVLPRLERICDEMGIHEGITLKLDTLTIDTGDIDSQDISMTWPEKIEQGFREELEKYTTEKLGAEQSQTFQSAEQTELGVLIHFLEHGTLPWYISDQDKTSPSTLLTKLLKEQPKALVEKISASKSKVSLSNRLIHQFTPSLVNQLLQQFKTPSSHIPINWLQKEIGKISTETASAFKSSFLFVKTITSIDSTTSNKSHSWYFDLLFEHFIDLNKSGQQTILYSINKNLTDNHLSIQNTQLLEDSNNHLLALQSLEKYLDKNDDSNSNFIDNNRLQNEVDLTESSPLTTNKEINQDETIESLNETDEFEQRISEDKDLSQNTSVESDNSAHNEKNSNSSIESDQDRRVREHLERIKKQQITKLQDAKQQPSDKVEASKAAQLSKQSIEETDRHPIQKDSSSLTENLSNPKEESTSSFDLNKQEINAQEGDTPRKETSERPEKHPAKKSKLDQNETTNKNHQQQSTSKAAQEGINDQSVVNPEEHEKFVDSLSSESDSELRKTVSNYQYDQIKPNQDRTIASVKEKQAQQLKTADSKHKTLNTKQEAPNNSHQTAKPEDQTQNTSNRLKYWQDEPEAISECYIINAGLVLFWPYLGHFFKDLNLIEKGKFHSSKHQEAAALTLQYLLSADPELDEHLLPLNKLLCGLKVNEPLGRELEFNSEDREKCNNLLETAIKNWPALRATTIPGFQKSFLNRKGVLKRHENHWQLQIEKMPFDMLIEQLPWPIGIVRLSWMNKPIYVEW